MPAGLSPNNCRFCRFPSVHCVCAAAQRLSLPTPLSVLLLMHVHENTRSSNSGHLARLVLPKVSLKLHGLREQPLDLTELGLRADSEGRPYADLVLFPGRGAVTLTPERLHDYLLDPATGQNRHLRLIVPDGNWTQATHMVKRLAPLAPLPRVAIPERLLSAQRASWRARRNIYPERVSTYEAISALVGMVTGEANERQMLELFDAAMLRHMVLRGKLKKREAEELLGMSRDNGALSCGRQSDIPGEENYAGQ